MEYLSFMISQFCFEAETKFTNDFAINETGIDILISISSCSWRNLRIWSMVRLGTETTDVDIVNVSCSMYLYAKKKKQLSGALLSCRKWNQSLAKFISSQMHSCIPFYSSWVLTPIGYESTQSTPGSRYQILPPLPLVSSKTPSLLLQQAQVAI